MPANFFDVVTLAKNFIQYYDFTQTLATIQFTPLQIAIGIFQQ